MKRLVLALVAACSFCGDVLAGDKEVTERNGAIALMGEVLAEAAHCTNLVANIDALDQYGHAFGVFLLSNEQDNLAVRELYKRGLDAIEKFGLDCGAVMNRYGPEGNVAVSLVANAGSIPKKNWMTSNASAYTDTKAKLKVMEKISLVYAATRVCGFKANSEAIKQLVYDNKIEIFEGSYDLRWIMNDAMVQAANWEKRDGDFKTAICKGIRVVYGPEGSEIPGLLN